MKAYEAVTDIKLPQRLPIIVRLDGNSFHNFTKLAMFERPFSKSMSELMIGTAIDVLQYCSGSVFAYTQSDEISILLRNNQTIRTQPFLANRVEKLISLITSNCTVSFYKQFQEWNHNQHIEIIANMVDDERDRYVKRKELRPTFDCRVFVLPGEEVVNYFIWRQQDAYKNCVSAIAESHLSSKYDKTQARKMLLGQTTDQRKKILQQHGYDIDIRVERRYKNGVAIRKTQITKQLGEIILGRIPDHVDVEEEVTRSVWAADYKTPIFTEDRDYIGGLL